MASASKNSPAKDPKKDRSKSEQEKLDDALDDSFPASDPPSMTDPAKHLGSGKKPGQAAPKPHQGGKE